jgi:hypothetical protein
VDRRDEAVAAAWDGRDIILPPVNGAENSSKIGDIDFKIAIVDERGRPGRGDQLFLRDKVTRGRDEHSEERKCPATDAHGRAGVKEKLPTS